MAEGLFRPGEVVVPGLSSGRLTAGMVRILPRTVVVLDWAETADEARARAYNEVLDDGSARWHRWFTREDALRVDDPVFNMGMVRHEFSVAVRAGLGFPAEVKLAGGGGGFAVSGDGLVVTNYHLVTAEIANFQREGGVLDRAERCRSLSAEVAVPMGRWGVVARRCSMARGAWWGCFRGRTGMGRGMRWSMGI